MYACNTRKLCSYPKNFFHESRFVMDGPLDTLGKIWDVGGKTIDTGLGVANLGLDAVNFVYDIPKNIKKLYQLGKAYLTHGFEKVKFKLEKKDQPNWALSEYRKTFKYFEKLPPSLVNSKDKRACDAAKYHVHFASILLHAKALEAFTRPATEEYQKVIEKLNELRKLQIARKARRKELKEVEIPAAQGRVKLGGYLKGSDKKAKLTKSVEELQKELAGIEIDISPVVDWTIPGQIPKMLWPPVFEGGSDVKDRLVLTSRTGGVNLLAYKEVLENYLGDFKPYFERYEKEGEKLQYWRDSLLQKDLPPQDKANLEAYMQTVDTKLENYVF